MTIPPRSPEALYHAVPPSDNVVVNESQIELDGETLAEPVPPPMDPPPALVDSRIHWVYFILGCSVLLPWNGAFLTCCFVL